MQPESPLSSKTWASDPKQIKNIYINQHKASSLAIGVMRIALILHILSFIEIDIRGQSLKNLFT